MDTKTIAATTAGVALATVATISMFGTPQCSNIPQEYAEIDIDGSVKRVVVADECFLNEGKLGDPLNFVVKDPSIKENGGAIGDVYDKNIKTFTKKKDTLIEKVKITATST